MSDNTFVNRDAFLRNLKAYAKDNGLAFSYSARKGKGGHGVVTVGSKFTTVKSGELGKTMVEVMLKQLGLPKDAV
ncbi:MAG: hypothetical protein JWM33_226 [Caulobacteraceae bacterium]|nr:hypothetical protein [Caulobacteraceae bacterium]